MFYFSVKCLNCSYEILRHTFQNVLTNLNPHIAKKPKEELVRPDGDVELSPEDVDRFSLATCPKCHSDLLKPDVIFFGDNVPKPRVQKVVDKNTEKLMKENERLQEHTKNSCRCWIWLLLMIVSMTFIGKLILILI